MTGPHLPWHRLEVDALDAEEQAHLDRCPRCRVDRRELRSSDAGLVPAEMADALRHARVVASDALLISWRTGSVERRGPVAPELLPGGSRFGSYEIDAFIGAGGMAVVYRARHTELQTQHALKVLVAPGRGLSERLLQEGRLQGQLRHPHIVGVTDVIEVSGAPALVLEYVPGPSLDRVLGNLSLTLPEADALALDVLAGMSAAHASGFVHRDLKPSNVLVDPTGDRVVAKVADFGLAKVVAGEHEPLNTRTGSRLGTLVYMAPEQVRDPRRVDTRSDVFTLGALLYELVTGQRCFGGVDMVDVVQRITTGRREPLSGDVPVRMVRAIDAALDLDPSKRPADAAALLTMWRDGRAERADPWTPERRALLRDQMELRPLPGGSTPSRPRWPLAIAGVVAVLVAVGLGLWAASSPPDPGAVMWVHDGGGAPGQTPHTTLTAVFSPELRGVYTAACVADGGRCAADSPDEDAWTPLVAAPTTAALTEPVATVSLGGIEAQSANGIYVGAGDLDIDSPRLSLDGSSVALPWPLPGPPRLEGDLRQPVQIGPEEGTTISWTPGGAGTPFLEVRPRQGGSGRLYRLRDDGAFSLPAEVFGPVPSQTDVVFGRQEHTRLDVAGRPVEVVARTQQWLTVVRVEADREALPGIGNCEESKYRTPLGPGRYWGLFDRAGATPPPVEWACADDTTLQGWGAIHPIAVPGIGALGVSARQPGGDLALWLAPNPYCQPVDCVAGSNRMGETEAMLVPGGGTDAVWNLGISEAAPHGGLYVVDLVTLSDPSEQRPEVSWTPDTLQVQVHNPADVEFRFGLAETQSWNGWYGEDCLNGNTEPPMAVCHRFVGPDLTLRRIPLAEQTRSGETTLFWSEIGEFATFFLETPNLLDDTGKPRCWSWGDAPAYYDQRDCTVLAEP